ncbi:hypothetical protein F5890DRAFT_1422619 [Lentinula detonsa]|uniref:Tc1-like transposase DDE domain-containing protein n=1 Tax=Lentinula detonsa TaxID=2804962 RepID=A0AA38UNW6_9AGAR|nr:hypothetical protein F5890DRAFT_1422619 [Lentinula detonsa]
MAWLTEHYVTVLPWPANSPDLSPIENAWHEVQRRVRLKFPDLLDSNQYFEAIKAEWQSQDFKVYIQHLYQSFPRRLVALRENEFRWIGY